MKDRLNLPLESDIKKVLRLDGNKLPSFPQVAAKLLELSKDESASLADLSKIVETDPGISVRVLEIVNSAMYGLGRKITALSEAVVFLGLDEIKKLENSAQIMPRAYSFQMADSAVVRYAPPVVHIDPKFYTKELSKMLKDNNSRIWINALGESDAYIRYGKGEEVLETLLENGANMIQTDEPEMLLQLLRYKGLHK